MASKAELIFLVITTIATIILGALNIAGALEIKQNADSDASGNWNSAYKLMTANSVISLLSVALIIGVITYMWVKGKARNTPYITIALILMLILIFLVTALSGLAATDIKKGNTAVGGSGSALCHPGSSSAYTKVVVSVMLGVFLMLYLLSGMALVKFTSTVVDFATAKAPSFDPSAISKYIRGETDTV